MLTLTLLLIFCDYLEKVPQQPKTAAAGDTLLKKLFLKISHNSEA